MQQRLQNRMPDADILKISMFLGIAFGIPPNMRLGKQNTSLAEEGESEHRHFDNELAFLNALTRFASLASLGD